MWIGQQCGHSSKRMSLRLENSAKLGRTMARRKPFVTMQPMRRLSDLKLAVIGLGYVGLPLATEFGKLRSVIGFDISQARIDSLDAGHDATLEISPEELRQASGLRFTSDVTELADCNTFIVTVPTPIDEHKRRI